MRKTAGHGRFKANAPHQGGDNIRGIAFARQTMHQNGFCNRHTDRFAGIEACKRILENHLDALAHMTQALRIQISDTLIVVLDVSAGGLDQPQQRAACG